MRERDGEKVRGKIDRERWIVIICGRAKKREREREKGRERKRENERQR